MTIAKLTLLTTAALLSNATFAAETANTTLRIEERFALNGSEKPDCTGSLRWGERCHSQNVATPNFGPAIATLNTAQPRTLMQETSLPAHRSLLARFNRE